MVRQGEGSMGISNSLGANTLDILMCLGLPWFVKTLITGEPVEMVSGALNITCLGLLGLVVIYFITMIIFKFTLTRSLGITYAILYLIYITFSVLIELNIFFEVNPSSCER
ncbi:Sodium potassium calcium exchanger 4-like protein, partial [Gryllus bimaculatus]